MLHASTAEDSRELPAAAASRALKLVIVALLIVYFLFLVVAKTPASFAAWAVHKAVPNLWLTSVQGTLWEGRAGAAQADMVGNIIPLGQVNWQLSPTSLLMLKPCLTFDTASTSQMMSGSVCQSLFGTTTVRDLNVDMPIAVIKDLLPIEARGQLSVSILSANITNQRVNSMDARFSWQNAAIALEDFRMKLGAFGGQAQHSGDGGIDAKIFDISGPFTLDLSASWHPGETIWKIEALVTPKDSAPPEAIQGLQLFGEEVETGTYKVVWP